MFNQKNYGCKEPKHFTMLAPSNVLYMPTSFETIPTIAQVQSREIGYLQTNDMLKCSLDGSIHDSNKAFTNHMGLRFPIASSSRQTKMKYPS